MKDVVVYAFILCIEIMAVTQTTKTLLYLRPHAGFPDTLTSSPSCCDRYSLLFRDNRCCLFCSVIFLFFFLPESLLFHSEALPTVVTCLLRSWKLVGWQHSCALRAVIHNKYRKLCLTKQCTLVSLSEKSNEWTLGLSKRHPTFSTSSLYKVFNHRYNVNWEICPQSLLFCSIVYFKNIENIVFFTADTTSVHKLILFSIFTSG